MEFRDLRAASMRRQKEWPGNENIDIPFRALEVAGEAGELSEKIKKWLRAERDIKGSTADIRDVAEEMADIIIAVDLLAKDMGINLEEAVSKKFNKTSEKYGLSTCINETGMIYKR